MIQFPSGVEDEWAAIEAAAVESGNGPRLLTAKGAAEIAEHHRASAAAGNISAEDLETFLAHIEASTQSEGLGVDGWSDAEDRYIESEVRHLQIKAEAKRRFFEADAPQLFTFEGGTLDEVWATAPDPKPLVERLLPEGGNLLLTAQRKAGKTTLVFNLAESLTTGKPFLGALATDPIAGLVGFLNYELTPGLVTSYTQEMITNPDRVLIVNLLGRANPLASVKGRAALATHLQAHSVEVLIVDPFSGAASGVDENSNSEVRAWLDELHRWALEDVGARALILSNHAGWSAERSRGASSLEDWANVLGLLTLGDKESKGSPRYFSAFGRLGELAEDRLDYDEASKTLTFSGSGGRRKNRTAAAASDLAPHLLPHVTDVPASGNAIIKRAKGAGVKASRTSLLLTISELAASGRIVDENEGASKHPKYRIGRPGVDFDPAAYCDELPDHDARSSLEDLGGSGLFQELSESDGGHAVDADHRP